MEIFFKNDLAVIDMGMLILKFIMLIVLLQISQIIYGGCLRSGGDVKYTLLTGIISVTFIRSAVTIILVNVFNMGPVGIWIGVLSDPIFKIYVLEYKIQDRSLDKNKNLKFLQ